MVAMRISGFGGIIPRTAPRLLPDRAAQAAANVSLLSGELRPLRKSKLVYTPAAAQAVNSIYKVDDSTWFVWPVARVQMERAALEGESRYVYTGDGVPKVTTKTLGTPVGSAGTPAAARTLGIPRPQAAPTLSRSGGTGAASTRFYVYTFYSDWNEESPESPVSPQITGKVDDTWVIGGMDDKPPNTGSVTAVAYSAGFVTVTLNATHYLRASEQITIASVLGMTDLNGVWTIDSVPAANQVKIALVTAQTYTSGGTWNRVNPWGTCVKRLYRTTGTKGQFQLVATLNAGVTTYNDTLTDAQIPGDALISQTWEPPPTNLIGLVSLPGGVLAGFLKGGRTICFCEPYQPHAWPVNYQVKVNDDIVGIGSFDSNLGIATTGFPVVLSGSEPGQMAPTRHTKPFPCLSWESVCSTADGVVFSTKNGLAYMDQTETILYTKELYTPEGWNALVPSGMKCAFDGSRLFVYSPFGGRTLILNIQDGGDAVNAYQIIDCVLSDRTSGDFYFARARSVYRFDPFDTAPLVTDWWSKEFLLPVPTNIGAVKIEFDEAYSAEAAAAIAAERAAAIVANQALMAGPNGGRGAWCKRVWNGVDWNGSILGDLPNDSVSVGFTLLANGKVAYSKSIPNQKAFSIAGGYKVDTFSVRIQANTLIRAIVVATSMRELANV